MERNANVFEFGGSKMIVSVKGPSNSKNFTMNTSFRPNSLSSTMTTMPRNFEKQSSAASVASQKSIYYGRNGSPTSSMRSDMQPRNFHQPIYQRGYSQRSVFNREGSPMSTRSIGSTVSRADSVINAMATWTDDELKKVLYAVKRKHEFRKAQKRRKMKFLKNHRSRFDDESEQGSCSSISSDDCASTRIGQKYNPYCKENVPRSLKSFDYQSEETYRGNRYANSDYARSESQNPYQTGANLYHPANSLPYQKQPLFFSHNEITRYSQSNTSFKNNIISQRCINSQANMSSIPRNNPNGSMCSTQNMQNMLMMSQRDRSRHEFQFPAQRFNRSTLHEEQDHVRNTQFSNKHCTVKDKNIHRDHIDELSDENDDIFSATIVKPKVVAKKIEKRKVESLGDLPNPSKKKPKMTSSNDKAKNQTQNKDDNEKNEFEFVKPEFPVRKSASAKPRAREELISKPARVRNITSNSVETEKAHPQPVAPSLEPGVEPEQSEKTQLTTSDMSMRPSFMKRKLFTQTLDVTENKNNTFESGTDSPQSNIYSALTREKHKTRKLVSSQSLLSRDVNQDDDNVLDLIRKIVPPNEVNSNITFNTSKPPNSMLIGIKTSDDKWDITSIISTCNNDSQSETYTDDEIIKISNDNKKNRAQEKPIPKQGKMDNPKNIPTKKDENPKLEIKKLDNIIKPPNNKIIKEAVKKNTLPAAAKVATPAKIWPAKRAVLSRSRIDTFWDTDESDHESDRERTAQPVNLPDLTENPKANLKQSSIQVQSSTLLTKAKSSQTKVVSPLVVLHDIMKDVKKQPSKKRVNKTKIESKPLMESNHIPNASKFNKKKNATPTIAPRTRRQLNLTTTSETANMPSNGKDTSINEKTPNKTKTRNKLNEKKETRAKNVKILSSELKENRNTKKKYNQHQKNIFKQQENSPKGKKTVKKDVKAIKLLEPTKHLKVLRSRNVDLSSSFNSDKFELKSSRQKSLSPSKRISFNKAKNVLANNTKVRSRATKS